MPQWLAADILGVARAGGHEKELPFEGSDATPDDGCRLVFRARSAIVRSALRRAMCTGSAAHLVAVVDSVAVACEVYSAHAAAVSDRVR